MEQQEAAKRHPQKEAAALALMEGDEQAPEQQGTGLAAAWGWQAAAGSSPEAATTIRQMSTRARQAAMVPAAAGRR